jgi:hypothetical protein
MSVDSIDARAALSRSVSRSVSGEKISIHSGRNASPFRQYVRQIKPKLRRGIQRNYSTFMSSRLCLVAKFSKYAPTRANLPECHPGDRSLTLTDCDGEIAASICPKQNLQWPVVLRHDIPQPTAPFALAACIATQKAVVSCRAARRSIRPVQQPR